jgi:uncharacterized protein (DUF302 family)
MPTDGPSGVVTFRGDGSIEQLLRRAVTRIEALGLEVIAVIDHSGDAAESGVAVPESKLVIFGNPMAAARLLVSQSLVALDLPPKLLIHESADGHVFVSFNSPAYLARRYALTDDEAEALRVVEVIARTAAGAHDAQ